MYLSRWQIEIGIMNKRTTGKSDNMEIGLIGDYDESTHAHQGISKSLNLAASAQDQPLEFEWVSTDSIESTTEISSFDGLWCVPGSPYRDMDGALRAIRYAREEQVPFLGTCGGFQHAVLEYSRNVLGWKDADHAETSPEAERPVISPLECSLVEMTEKVEFADDSRLRQAYAVSSSVEGYHCNYGMNPEFEEQLSRGSLRITARHSEGGVRALELDDHPFYVLMLFQPERAALDGSLSPIVGEFATVVSRQ